MSSIKRRLKRKRNKKQAAEITLWRDESSAMADPGRCHHCGRTIETTFHNCQPAKSAGSSS